MMALRHVPPPLAALALIGAAAPHGAAPHAGEAAAAARTQVALRGLYLQNQALGRGDVWNYYYFWPDGHVCHTMPKGGMDPAPAYETVARQEPAECGAYALRGGQLTVQLGGKAPSTLTITNPDRSGGFALSDFPTIRVPAFAPNTRLNGRWRVLEIRGRDYRDETYTFGADGTFAYDERPMRASGAPPVHVAGTYTLGGNTLQLSTGQRLSAHEFPAAGDRRLGLDGRVLQPT